MLIKKIKLSNIRSFLEQEIDFPEGSVLLSGDIGAGKSSVLLAIDFALFGLGRGALSGASLLRNGKKNGSVELSFEVDGKNAIIKRTLKREANVNQDSGYIIIDNVKKELTPIELKQAILNLLNYPAELLMKSKPLIYRYTVYTPQEEMKRILLEDRDSRLDILRRVFGIDKYKRVNENSDILISFLKDKIKEGNIKILDLEDKRKELEEANKSKKDFDESISGLNVEIDKINKEINEKNQKLKELEDDIKKSNDFKKQIELIDNNIRFRVNEFNNLGEEIKETDEKIKRLEKEAGEEIVINENELKEKENKINSIEKEAREIYRKVQNLKTKKEQSFEIIKNISDIDTCPICMQNVNEEYKDQVIDRENSKVKEFDFEIEKEIKEQITSENEIKNLKLELQKLRELLHKAEIIKVKSSNLNEAKSRKEKLSESMIKAKKEISEFNIKKIELQKEIEKFIDINEKYELGKEELEELKEKSKELEIEKIGFKKELENLNKKIEIIEKEINEKLKIKEKIEYFDKLISWIDEYFIKIIDFMEKNIMIKVHNDFNTLFQKWFSVLVDSEMLKIKMDEEFTPVIEQAGHEIEYDFLSGGERTAAALAYRLALNQVINSIVSTIKTKDLIVLDEPTEGFSSEQLDKLKFVLDELSIKQVILVSHESKIESFVDNVIRFEKKDHVSKVI